MEKGFVRKLYKIPVDQQRAMLRADGLKDGEIYEHGKGGEDIGACIRTFRDRGGVIKIAADMRVFGETQDEITKVVDKIELAHIQVVDLAHPELKTISAQQRYAFGRIAFMRRWDGNRKRAGQTGSDGGKAKAIAAAAKRASRVPDEPISRMLWIVENRMKMTYKLMEWVLGGKPFSVGTLRRHYEASEPPPEPKSRKARK